METFSEEMPVDEILQHIRDAIIDNERKKYFRQFLPESAKKKAKPDEDVFLLSQNMMVNREDIPYQLGVWKAIYESAVMTGFPKVFLQNLMLNRNWKNKNVRKEL